MLQAAECPGEHAGRAQLPGRAAPGAGDPGALPGAAPGPGHNRDGGGHPPETQPQVSQPIRSFCSLNSYYL